jgi:hypothetical protein
MGREVGGPEAVAAMMEAARPVADAKDGGYGDSESESRRVGRLSWTWQWCRLDLAWFACVLALSKLQG